MTPEDRLFAAMWRKAMKAGEEANRVRGVGPASYGPTRAARAWEEAVELVEEFLGPFDHLKGKLSVDDEDVRPATSDKKEKE